MPKFTLKKSKLSNYMLSYGIVGSIISLIGICFHILYSTLSNLTNLYNSMGVFISVSLMFHIFIAYFGCSLGKEDSYATKLFDKLGLKRFLLFLIIIYFFFAVIIEYISFG